MLFDPVMNRRLGMLVDQLVRRVKGRGGGLRYVGNARATQSAPLAFRGGGQFHPVKLDRAVRDARSVPRIPHGGGTDGGLARTGFANQTHDLTTVKRQVDALDDGHPGFFRIALDPKIADFEQYVFIFKLAHSYCSLRPEDRNSIQSTTKLTETVSNAMAAAGISGVMSPNEISVAFSRTIDPQSAVGG